MEILSVAVGLLADADPTRPAEDAIDFRRQPFRLADKPVLAEVLVERNQKHHSEGIGPQIAQSVGPDAVFPHPAQLGEHVVHVS